MVEIVSLKKKKTSVSFFFFLIVEDDLKGLKKFSHNLASDWILVQENIF